MAELLLVMIATFSLAHTLTSNSTFYCVNLSFSEVLNLDWSQTSEEYIKTHLKDTEIIIAADVIYDNTLFDSLLTTLRMLFDHCTKCTKFMLVNAVRNPETEQEFLTKLSKNVKLRFWLVEGT